MSKITGQKLYTCLEYFNVQNVNCAAISRKLNVNERRIQRYYNKFVEMGNINQVGKLGRPELLSGPQKTQISRIALKNRTRSAEQIANIFKNSQSNIPSPEKSIYQSVH